MKKGDKVIFTEASDEQVRWGGNDDPRLVLEIGKEYEIDEVEEHTWHTKVQIAGVKGRFNSVHFQPAPIPADPDDEKAAALYAVDYESERDYKAAKKAFLAGCAHKAQTTYTRQQMEDCWEARLKYFYPDRDTFINSLKP